MLLLACRSLFFVAVIFGYSTGIWRLINDYFRKEFKQYLSEEVKQNKYLLVVDPSQLPASVEGGLGGTGGDGKSSRQSVTANRLLDELIIGFGRYFTTRNEKEFVADGGKSGKNPPKDAPTGEENAGPAEHDPTNNCVDSTTLIGALTKGDGKLPASFSSSNNNNKDDGEENWINYWKNKRPTAENKGVAGDATDSGSCERNPANEKHSKIDSCERNPPRG